MGVGVDQGKVRGAQAEDALRITQVVDPVEVEGEAGGLAQLTVRQRQQAEFIAPVHSWEDRAAVLEVEEADKRPPGDECSEEMLGGVVGRDSGRDDETSTAIRRQHVPGEFSEDGVGVDIAPATVWEAAALAHKAALALGGAERLLVFSIERWILVGERGDAALAFSCIGSAGNLRGADAEELFFL